MVAKVKEEHAPLGPFQGFTPRATEFFAGLAANNNRDWFLAHKGEYEAAVRQPLGALVEALALAFAARGIPLAGSAKSAIFRINRDIRFSRNKEPYKTNAGAVLSRDGTKSGNGVFYFQLGSPGDCFAAMGFYGPEPADLARLRDAITAAPAKWLGVEAALRGNGLALSRHGGLTRMPKGFEGFAASDIAETLKLKGFTVALPLSDEQILGGELVERLAHFASAGLPLLEFGWKALAR
jgi:uncharacterized protein (TIGR02453 family)